MLLTKRKIDCWMVEDNYEEGEIGRSERYDIPLKGKYENLDELFKELDNFGFEKEYMCFEEGVLCCNAMTDKNGARASKEELELWKKGQFKLYSNYCQIEITVISEEHVMTKEEFDSMI